MPRLLVLDIDGTLLNPSDIVTPVVHAAIAAARAAGVEVALATGRRLRSARRIVAEVGIRLPLVLSNGALVWNTEHEQVMNQIAFTPEKLAIIARESLLDNLAPVLMQGPRTGERLVVPENAPQPEFVNAFVGRRLEEVDLVPASELGNTPDVLTVDVFGPEQELRRLTSRFAALGFSVFHSGPFGMDPNFAHWAANIHMPGVSKASGVALLAADLGLTMSDVVAVGDGENDLPMLEAAGLGVAMGNASAYVRERADVVVRGHDEDGVAEAIERFVLNRATAN
ncbi:MAG TPA: HAD family hydrolase [Nitrolancea sp.]|nr:HAD family hydrolase [Nitrolancea sp.]